MTAIPLVGGLVLNQPQTHVPPGTLQECFNFEVTLDSGYTVVRGFEPIDGRPFPEIDGSGLTNEQYDEQLVAALDAYRSTVLQVPGEDPMGVKFFQDRAWVVTHSEDYFFSDADALLDQMPFGQPFIEAAEPGTGPAGYFLHKGTEIEIAWLRKPETVSGFWLRLLSRIEFSAGADVPESGQMSGGGKSFEIRGREIFSGDPDNGTAKGILWVESINGTPAADDVFTDGGTGSIKVDAVFGLSDAAVDPAVTVSSFLDPVRNGVIAHTTPRGWRMLRMGFTIPFDQGRALFGTVYNVGLAPENEPSSSPLNWRFADRAWWNEQAPDADLEHRTSIPFDASTPNLRGRWYRRTAALSGPRNLRSNTGNEFVFTGLDSADAGAGSVTASAVLRLADWGLNIPDGLEITGIQLELVVSREFADQGGTEANAVYRLSDVRISLPGGVSSVNKAPATQINSETTSVISIGGDGDLWGLAPTREGLNSETLQARIQVAGDSATASTGFVRIHRARLRIYAREETPTVTIRRSGTDIGQIDVLYADYVSGSVDDNDAQGVISARNFRDMMGVAKPFSDIQVGDEVRAGPGGGALMASVSDTVERSRLPTQDQLDAEDSRYQFIDTNFFASESLEAVYGVSGVGSPFTFNDNYFFFIRTGAPAKSNKPRHIKRSVLRLVLGYANGNIDMSVAGRPDSFDGLLGAITLGIGERIMGLSELPGDALGIIGRRSVRVLLDNQLQTISPNAGALEYSVSLTDQVFFCDQWGVATIEAVQAYGDFGMGRLSDAVAAIVQPRFQGAPGAELKYVDVTRSNNQFHMHFADGLVITMSMSQNGAQFTEQSYWTDEARTPKIAKSIDTDIASDGRERKFILFEGDNMLYEMNRGTSFAGQDIVARFATNPISFDVPAQNKRFNTLHVHGRAATTAEIGSQVGENYALPAGQKRSIRIGKPADQFVVGGRPFFSMTEHNARSRDLGLAFSYQGKASSPFTIQSFEWPDVSPRKLER